MGHRHTDRAAGLRRGGGRVKVRLGVIGCGFAAREIHAPRLAQLDDLFEVRATCDVAEPAARAVAESLGAELVYTEADRLLAEDELDAVAVLTPVHGPLVEAALGRGLDVFVEKPMAEHPDTAAALTARAGAGGRVLMVGTMRTHDRALVDARAALDEVGPLLWVELRDACSASASAPSPIELTEPGLQAALPEDAEPRRRNALQTGLLELIHDLSILRALFPGEISCVDAWAGADGWELGGRLALGGGVPCSFAVAEYGRVRAEVFDVSITAVGERGIVRLAFADANQPQLPTRLEVSERPAVQLTTDTYLEEWREFHRLVEAGGAGGNGAAGAADVRLLFDIVERALA
jgi:predicted dehydrogenase